SLHFCTPLGSIVVLQLAGSIQSNAAGLKVGCCAPARKGASERERGSRLPRARLARFGRELINGKSTRLSDVSPIDPLRRIFTAQSVQPEEAWHEAARPSRFYRCNHWRPGCI